MARVLDDDDDIIRRLRDLPKDAAVTTREASIYLGLSESTLEKARVVGNGAPYIRATNRSVRYRIGDLDEYMSSRRVASTSEYR